MSVPEAIKYRREFVGVFNVGVSLLKDRATEESMSLGRSATFDVSAVGGRMNQRSVDGRIPRTNVSDTQVNVQLEEYVKKFEVTDFEKFTSQSDERAKMNWRIMESANQEIDYDILASLATATSEYSASAAAITLAGATKVIASLARNSVPINPNDVTWVISPDMEAKLQEIPAYTSSDYVASKPLPTGGNQYSGERQIKSWLNVGWIVHPNLPGAGTSSCTTYLWHRKALGCAAPEGMIKYAAGYDDEDHYHYCSASLKQGSKLLQQNGITRFHHDDTA